MIKATLSNAAQFLAEEGPALLMVDVPGAIVPKAANKWYPLSLGLVPWLCLLAALCWSVVLRIPLIINAPIHLDSDLAVDGLTLQQAVQGRWRWHYPGTPYTGIGAVLLSWPQARIWGTNAATLVSGGTVAHVLLMIAVFSLARRALGRVAAVGSLLPLTFASTGAIWLSGRITGGHLLIVAWSAWAWLLFHEAWTRRGWFTTILLGLCCGFGVYLDSMFLLTLTAMAGAGLIAMIAERRNPRRQSPPGHAHPNRLTLFAGTLVLLLAFLAGASPRVIGQLVDPYDAYHEQFSSSWDGRLLAEHGRLFVLECLPRLITGHRLPGLESDPDPALLGTGGPIQNNTAGRASVNPWTILLVMLSLAVFVWALLAVGAAIVKGRTSGSRALALGLLVMTLAVLVAFVVNRNIFNSDNYRYLVLLLIPWAIGCGRAVEATMKSGGPARINLVLVILVLSVLFTCDVAAWYRRMGWVDRRLVPAALKVEDPALSWLARHPEIESVFGGYWDVYRLSFLRGGEVRGVPFPLFPNRFPEWSVGLPGGRPATLVARRSPDGQMFLGQALREGGTILSRAGGLTIVRWPWPEATPNRRRSP